MNAPRGNKPPWGQHWLHAQYMHLVSNNGADRHTNKVQLGLCSK